MAAALLPIPRLSGIVFSHRTDNAGSGASASLNRKLHGSVRQVLGVGIQFPSSFSRNTHHRVGSFGKNLHGQRVPQVQGHAQAIVARTEVGGRGWRPYFHGSQGSLRKMFVPSAEYVFAKRTDPGLGSPETRTCRNPRHIRLSAPAAHGPTRETLKPYGRVTSAGSPNTTSAAPVTTMSPMRSSIREKRSAASDRDSASSTPSVSLRTPNASSRRPGHPGGT